MERLGLVLLGPPGSGKGTQARRLQNEKKFRHISTGDLLRMAIKEGTPVGKLAEKYIKEGILVPDEVIIKLVKDALLSSSLFVLDGFPRNIAQAHMLEPLLREIKGNIKRAVLLNVSDEEIVRRLLARRVCPSCGKVYNLLTSPPKNDSVCDICGVELVRRQDDNEKTIRNRLRVYREETAPVVDYYRRRELLGEVDASKTPEEIYNEIIHVIGDL